MKTKVTNSTKRVLSLVVAIVMLVGTLFTANVGVSVTTDAAQATVPFTSSEVIFRNNQEAAADTSFITDGSHAGTEADPYIISTVEHLLAIAQCSSDYTGKYFKVKDGIKVISLQSEYSLRKCMNTSDNIAALNAFIDLEDVTAVKDYFANATSKYNWRSNNGTSFNGNIDFNGATIVGMYGIHGGLITNVGPNASFKNVAIKNSYVTSDYTSGALIGRVYYDNISATTGTVKIENVEVGNCYVESTADNHYVGALLGRIYEHNANIGLHINNCIVYGNEVYSTTNNRACLLGTMSNVGSTDKTATTYFMMENTVAIGCIPYWTNTNSTAAQAGRPAHFTNVYTDKFNEFIVCPYYTNNNPVDSVASWAGHVDSISADNAIDGHPKALLSLTFAETEADKNTGKWFINEGYATPVMPLGWNGSVKGYSLWSGDSINTSSVNYDSGSGTKDDPYIISTADQLWKMVKEQSYENAETVTYTNYTSATATEQKTLTKYTGTKYYKVADGIKYIYLNKITTLQGLKDLVTNNKAKSWRPGSATVFCGNFDGNGATIRGLYTTSYSADNVGCGLVYKLDGEDCVIKNVNFEACYTVTNAGGGYGDRGAIITTNLGQFGYPYYSTGEAYSSGKQDKTAERDVNITISNVSMRSVCVKSNKTENLYSFPMQAGFVSTDTTPDSIKFVNCLFDGNTSELLNSDTAAVLGTHSSAGIISCRTDNNKITVNNCVSIGAPIVPMVTSATYKYDSGCNINNCYSAVVSSELNKYTMLKNGITDITGKTTFATTDLPLLDWSNSWQMVTVEDDRTIPMPTANALDNGGIIYANELANQYGKGANTGIKASIGKYGWTHELVGSGTEADPYIITNALQLARAIGSGGVNLNDNLYYKLSCDIDLAGAKWLTQDGVGTSYYYVPFKGTLDGDGHVIKGLYTADKDGATGLIPVLEGGTVKNLHIRDSYAASTAGAGLIVGEVKSGTIEGCSAEYSLTNATGTAIIGASAANATITNTYYIANGEQTLLGADTSKLYPAADAVWYKGNDGKYRHISFAKSQTIADIDGDGAVSYGYSTNDLAALRNHLLDADGFANVFGDVNRDGKTSIGDLAIIRREMANDYKDIKDGFWRNIELGKVSIYYAENDTQDMARRMELYLESVFPTVDVIKYAGDAVTDSSVANKANYTDQENAIVITKGTPTDSTYMNYEVEYDKNKNVLTIDGDSFTAVEYAVNKFIANSDPTTDGKTPYTTSGSIATTADEKHLAAKVVNGKTYYYAWGDEFEGDGNDNTADTYSTDNWLMRIYKYEETASRDHTNMEGAASANLKDLWDVHDGKLTIWRGVNTDVYGAWDNSAWGEGNGYKGVAAGAANTTNDMGSAFDSDDKYIDPNLATTEMSMLFKQGYAEMRASLPSDGHAFPAWWFLNGGKIQNNSAYTQNLYGKIYKPNPNWNKTDAMVPGDLTTYKYQVPKAYLEFDIVELQQLHADGNFFTGAADKGAYRDYFVLSIHKIYNQNVKDGTLYVPEWSNNTTTEYTSSAFNNTSSISSDFIHKYSNSKTTANFEHSDADGSFSIATAINNGKLASGKTLQDEYTYGFSWTVNKSNNTYDLTVYIDFDDDGEMETGEVIFNINQATGHDVTDDIFNNDKASETAIWNQYAHMLLDNSYYTSTYYDGLTLGDKLTLFSDLLTKDSNGDTSGASDKTTFDIEYVRVYQENGKRDIVTPETEAFNNGNHFGY